jgi:hypothetical protein
MMNIAALFAGWNLCRTGNVLGIEELYPDEEETMHFGPTDKEEELSEITAEELEAKRTARKTSTIAGLSIEVQIQKQQIKKLWDRQKSIEGLMNTILQEMKMLKELHAKQLNAVLNGGPTE